MSAGRSTCQFGFPGTLCVQERLPPGAAAVVLSRYHASPDLILPIDTREKGMFDAIDGRRSIATIVDRQAADALSRARTFFEQLLVVRPDRGWRVGGYWALNERRSCAGILESSMIVALRTPGLGEGVTTISRAT